MRPRWLLWLLLWPGLAAAGECDGETGASSVACLQARLADTAAESFRRRNAALGLAVIAGLLALVLVRERRRNRRRRGQEDLDPLTGLRSRANLRTELDTLGAMRDPQRSGSSRERVLFRVDVDDLGAINRSHGQGAGDGVLREVAGRLLHTCRSGDLLARWGGKAFLIACPRIEREQSARLAERLRRAAAARPLDLGDGRDSWITVSIGYAPWPLFEDGPAGDWEAAAAVADQAVTRARDLGGDAWVGLWGEGLPEELRQSLDVAVWLESGALIQSASRKAD